MWQCVERTTVVDAGDGALDELEERLVLVGRGVAHGVGDVDGGGSGLDGGGDHLHEEGGIGAGAVFGRELDVVDKGEGEPDGGGGLIESFFAADLELGGEVEVGGGEEDVDAGLLRGFDRARGGLDIFALAPGERGDARAADLAGDLADGFRVTGGGDREAGLEDVDAEIGELVRHAELLVVVHGAAGRLLAIAERGVEEDDVIGCGRVFEPSR